MLRSPFSFRTAAALVVALAATVPAFAETIDNPAFKSWASQKKGTVVTTKMISSFGDQKSETTITNTLTDLSADVATLEMVSTVKVGTMEFKAPGTKVEVKKTYELPKGKTKADFEKPEGLVDQGTETLKIDGVEYKTKWMKIKTEANGSNIESKTWTCDDVPNTMVKMETKVTTGNNITSTTMELVSVKKP